MSDESRWNETCWHGAGSCLEGLEAEFFGRNAELNQLSFVDSDGIIVGFGRVVDAVFQVLDSLVLVLNWVLNFSLDLFDELGVEGGGLQDLVKLSFFLLQLLKFFFQPGGEGNVVEFSMLFDFVGQFLELVLEIFPIQHYFLVLVAELVELFAHSMDLFFDRGQLALIVFPAHFMLLELSEERFQLIPLQSISF